jgi:hypothetical protein
VFCLKRSFKVAMIGFLQDLYFLIVHYPKFIENEGSPHSADKQKREGLT